MYQLFYEPKIFIFFIFIIVIEWSTDTINIMEVVKTPNVANLEIKVRGDK